MVDQRDSTESQQPAHTDSANSLCLTALLPHRAPMLLLEKAVAVAQDRAEADVLINDKSPFFVIDKGVPSWIGLEYMGQTAALIAGFQQQLGALAPHTGFLLGCRSYQVLQPWFLPDIRYRVTCMQDTVLGESLASFKCEITPNDDSSGQSPTSASAAIATAKLTVFRRPAEVSDL